MTSAVIKVPFGRMEITFDHKEEIQTGGNHKCCTLKSWLAKILNLRAFLNKPEKSDFFKFISSTKKNPELFKNSEHWNSRYEFWCIPSYFSPSLQLRSPLVIFKLPPTPNKGKFPWQEGDKLEEISLTSPNNYGSIYPWVWQLSLRGFKGRFMFNFYVDPDLDILFENLTAQIVARVVLDTQLPFETLGDLWVDIIKMQQLTLG